MSAGSLYCDACRMPLPSTKKSHLEQHIKSSKHLRARERLDDLRDQREKRLSIFEEPSAVEIGPAPETAASTEEKLSLDLFRRGVVRALLVAGIPLSKVNILLVYLVMFLFVLYLFLASFAQPKVDEHPDFRGLLERVRGGFVGGSETLAPCLAHVYRDEIKRLKQELLPPQTLKSGPLKVCGVIMV